ncbi:U11/U12 small nuclear ribonucleoprotein 31 kDa protein-like [Cucumis sativus]|uniref:U11/U12 small nuclear ribonucleoprotein 31 kDa protein-like n=1 Tax=Cucumis sativus TaxID=3659 RepID=UPI0012F4D5A5|nr:U11/U12 small nuclear ribonucleoprotein 31 kDa protein-like [Cucumis sativus]XP_031737365.1 U11/U12 small nuclear ribonucleoprotein 31 kDa protein-like [Cucumis sativus]XP_031737378.1 U11/U12 small nuclear ribonucleoprotein 31 kDa protein-like [Cucumis sativus]XP_031737379.1 U11/U12 small nuclear ribonucleoprotein 31 kDa protein-like [Cucumis sativus]
MAPKGKKTNSPTSDSDEDETFYYGIPPPPLLTRRCRRLHSRTSHRNRTHTHTLPLSLAVVLEIARVTVLKDRQTRKSRGVAFVQFISQDDAVKAAKQMHGKILNGRVLKAAIATDNGRAAEFIRKRVYKDKSRCYECGAIDGHLSYECPKNQLGPRERPEPKRVRRGGVGARHEEDWGSDVGEGFEDDNWASVVDGDADQRLLTGGENIVEKKKRRKQVISVTRATKMIN